MGLDIHATIQRRDGASWKNLSDDNIFEDVRDYVAFYQLAGAYASYLGKPDCGLPVCAKRVTEPDPESGSYHRIGDVTWNELEYYLRKHPGTPLWGLYHHAMEWLGDHYRKPGEYYAIVPYGDLRLHFMFDS
jgi:hypothetical protein